MRTSTPQRNAGMRRAALPGAVAATMLVALAGLYPAAAADRGPTEGPGPSTYVNPISAPFADTYADPSLLRGKDGWWYAYGTTDPLRGGGEARRLMPISRSHDLVTWEYVGDVFTEDTAPSWSDRSRGAALWAPDIRYVDGQYRLYYVVTDTTVTDEPNDNAIGMATAPTPAGPWTDTGAPVVGPRRGGGGEPGNFQWTFDPTHIVGAGGVEYLFYGSYYGGIWVTELAPGGTRATGEPTMVAVDNKFEGAYVVQRDGWWYLFASTANCCAGPTTGYSVQVGRSRDVAGPYVDREGVPLAQSRAGGTPVLTANGNRWIGTGHNAIATDLAGQDWIAYHAIDRTAPYLDEPFGINARPMLLDRLDWIDGWPAVRAGVGPSDSAEPAPAAVGRTATNFTGGIDREWQRYGTWRTGQEPDAGTYLQTSGRGRHLLTTRRPLTGDVRVEADLRLGTGSGDGGYGVVAGLRPAPDVTTNRGASISARLDRASKRLIVETVAHGRVIAQEASALPAGYRHDTWHNLALEVRAGHATATLTNARLGDPLAVVSLEVPDRTASAGRAGTFGVGGGVQVDNLSALPAATPVTRAVPPAGPGELVPGAGDEFDEPALSERWNAVREPRTTLVGGALRWPVEATDLVGTGNDAGLLLQEPPAGDWTAETKLTMDLGTDTIRNFQQGGLIAYVHDDLFTRLSTVAIWNTRQAEFGKEMPFAGSLSYGGTIVGPPSDTTWLRLTHRTDASGEHKLRASSSTDGTTWVHGGTWTLPADADLQVGLLSHGLQGGGMPATAQFDYLRFYAD